MTRLPVKWYNLIFTEKFTGNENKGERDKWPCSLIRWEINFMP